MARTRGARSRVMETKTVDETNALVEGLIARVAEGVPA